MVKKMRWSGIRDWEDEPDKWIVCGDWELVYDNTPTFLSAG